MQVEAGALVRQTAERYGDRAALTSQARSMSFAELNQAANRVGSALLQLGARRGDRVGVLAYNTPEVVEAWFGFEKHNLVRAVLHSHFPMDAHVASSTRSRRRRWSSTPASPSRSRPSAGS